MFSAGSEGSIIKLIGNFHVGFSSQLLLGMNIIACRGIYGPLFSDDDECVYKYMHLIQMINYGQRDEDK